MRRLRPACIAIAAPVRVLAPALALLLTASVAFAQQAVLQAAQGPYYAGTPIDLQVVADGFDEEPAPEASVPQAQGGTLDFVAMRPQVSSFMSIINGSMSQRKEVRFAFAYRLTAPGPGRYTVGPFQITQGAKSAATKTATFDVVQVPVAQGQRLRVLVGDAGRSKLYVGQRVPVTVEWWTESGLADNLYNQRMSVPLFSMAKVFSFIDDKHEQSRVSLNIDTSAGTVEFPADIKQVTEDGKQWVVRSVTRTMIPVAPGSYDLEPSSLWVDQAVGWRRDFFGSRIPNQVQKRRVSADKQTFVVEPLPSAGRPASFGGAIGEGFTLEVAAERTVVQTGDPVKLTLTLRGDGSFESAGLPPLSGSGLSPAQFRLPDGEISGVFDGSAKRFEVTVRILDPNLREIPPIAYSWFNPKSQTFETTRSAPIALSVRAAEVVGASDVVSAAPAQPAAKSANDEDGQDGEDAPTRGEAEARNTFTLTGADLSIETDPSRLGAGSASVLAGATLRTAAYGLGILAMLAGLVLRRRSELDPVAVRLRKDLDEQRNRIAAASGARDIADGLRRIAALRSATATGSDGDGVEIDALLGRLDELTFAPGGAVGGATEELRTRALAVADRIRREAR